MPDISVKVREKIAQAVGTPEIVCGNSDYVITFDFDSEWRGYDTKTARFVRCNLKTGQIVHTDVVFEGNSVTAPVLYDTAAVAVGVYAGDIHTTTPARIPCARCITDGEPEHEDPDPDVYAQILAYLEELSRERTGSTPTRVLIKLNSPETAGYLAHLEEETEE